MTQLAHVGLTTLSVKDKKVENCLLTNMFPLLNRNVPHVERKILSFLGDVHLISAAFVCKSWYRAVENKEERNILLWAIGIMKET